MMDDGKHNNWKTPSYIYDELHREFDFDFDPCPFDEGEITPAKDGLILDWGDRNFVNPPYSKTLKNAFVERAVIMKDKGKLSVVLIPARTGTNLFHNTILPNVTEPVRFLHGRVRFSGYNSRGKWVENSTGMTDSMIAVFDGRKK